MHFQRPIIYCAFSNDAEYTLRLFEEEGCISTVLTELDKQGKIEYKHKDKSSLDNVYDFFNDYHNRVFIFHYGGHSDSEFLHFHEHSARSEPLATLIGQQKHLKLVFLNGCANRPQVQALLHQGVPAIIATRESVGDNQAIVLAEQFYKALANGKTIQQSFEAAKSYLQQKHGDRELVRERGCRPRAESPDHPFPWGLYYENEAVLDWHIGQAEQESKIEILSQLREASRKRHQKFTSPGGRFQHLDIQQAILAGIRDIAPNRTVRFEENVDLDGERLPLLESLSSLWGSANPHSLVVGAGGMGKTVSLLRLWKRWSVEEREDIPVPIFIQLNEFNNNPEQNFIQNYIRRHYADLELDEVLKTPAIGQGGKPQPHILLLLDGFNEVTATSNELILEINRLRVQEDYPGIQMVLSSRVDIRSTYQWQSFHLLELQPLSDPQIQAYLREGFPSDSRLLEVLRNPMMLSIYATQSELPKRYLERGLLKEQVTSTGEMLFNVEAIQRIKIEEQFSLQQGALLLHRFVLEHLLPFLGWTMQQAGSFSLEETGLHQFLAEAPEYLLQKDFFLVFKDFRKIDREALNGKEAWELQEELIDQICCQGLTMLVAENNSYRFLHQNFRDYFAARYLQNLIRLALHQKILPEVFQKAPLDFYIRQMLGELEGEHTNKMEWKELEKRWQWSKGQFFLENNLTSLLEQCRGVFDDKQLGYIVWNLLTIWKEQRYTFNGANLSQLNFRGFSFNGLDFVSSNLPFSLSGSVLREENIIPQGHAFGVENVTFSPDGSCIISSDGSGPIKIWDAKTGQCLFNLGDNHEIFESLLYTSDGQLFIFSSYNKQTINIWNGQTGQRLLTLEPFLERITSLSTQETDWRRITSLAISPDGQSIASSHTDKTFNVWNAQTGQCLLTLEPHSERIYSLVYSPDASRIVTSSEDGTAKIWEVRTGDCLLTLCHGQDIIRVAYSPNGKHIFSQSLSNINVWDAQTGQCLLILESHSMYFIALAISPDGSHIASALEDGEIRVWNTQNGLCELILEGHSRATQCLAYSPNGSSIISCSNDNKIKVWDALNGKCLSTLAGHWGLINSLAYSPDGHLIVSGSYDKTIKVWDVQTGQCLLTLDGQWNWVTSLAYSPDGSRIISSANDSRVKVWDTHTWQCIFISYIKGNRNLTYNPNGYQVISSGDKVINVWDAQTWRHQLTLEGHLDQISSLAYSPDGQRIASGSKDKTAKIWDAHTGQCLLTLDLHTKEVTSLAYSPDGSHIVTGSEDGIAKIWGVQTGDCLLTLRHWQNVQSVAYSPNGQCIVSCTDKRINIWNAQTGEKLLTFPSDEYVSTVAYTSDGCHILSNANYGKIKIWDAKTGECLFTMENYSIFDLLSVSLSPDGRRIVSSSINNIKVWDAQTWEELFNLPNIPDLFIYGCDFRNLHPKSKLSSESISLLRHYGAIFNDEDAQNWAVLMEKHFAIKF